MRELCKRIQLLEPLDVSKVRITKDHYYTNAYIIDLPLDAVPDHAWQDFFERAWKTSQDLWERKLYVMGDKIRLIATTDQLEDKLVWVRQVIDRTNQEIDAYNQIVPLEKEAKRQSFQEDKTTIEMIRETLRKGFPAATR